MSIKKPKAPESATDSFEIDLMDDLSTQKKIKQKSSKPAPSPIAETAEAAPVVENTVKPHKKKKLFKVKVIRDSFSFPEQDYQKIFELKKNCLAAGMHVKKSEILRAGLQLLTQLNLTELQQALDGVEKIKTGRPKS